MASNKSTLIFLPGGSSQVRKISIPNRLIPVLSFLIVVAIVIIGLLVNDYRRIKSQIPELQHLRKESKIQKTQLVALCKEITQSNQKIAALQEFDHKLRIMTNLLPSGEQDQFLGVGGSNMSTLKPDYQLEDVHSGLIQEMHEAIDGLNTEIVITALSQNELSRFLEEQKSLLACTPSLAPTNGWYSSGFGYRISPFTNKREFHKGLDIATRIGTPIIAPADGLVVSVGREGNYGRMIAINHGYNMKTRYGHLHKYRVKKGDRVKRGQIIAEVGKTGRCTGPHLHYEVLLSGVPVNPLRYILD
jgi:murein DD-endopeptidase MepM/ murein hydrolase activator NlpD